MKKRILSALLILVLFAAPMMAFAHGGRTDSSGGHKDNKNASGLGYYHYHHGYEAHLHTNGVCPYSFTSNSTPKTTATKTTSPRQTTINIIKPSFPIIVNGASVNDIDDKYYPVVINDVTYVPLSTDVIKLLELSGGWQGASAGIVLNSK